MSSFRYLIPTITIVRDKLIKKKENASCAAIVALADALINGLDRRFARYLNNGEMIAAALLHPCFRKGWPVNDTQMQAGNFYNATNTYIPIPVSLKFSLNFVYTALRG